MWPSHRELQNFHYDCLQGAYFDERLEVQGGTLLFSHQIRDSYYNFMGIDEGTCDDVLSVSSEFHSRDRLPAVYLIPREHVGLSEQLTAKGFEFWATDSWLGLDIAQSVPKVVLPSSVQIEYVSAGGEEPYVQAFASAYSGAEQDDPYGPLDPGYTRALKDSFSRKNNAFTLRYLQATESNRVIGVAMIAIKNDVAGIYGVGVIPSARHRGLGRALADQLALDAADHGVTNIFLQTESKSQVEHWYMSFGYKHLFDAHYLVKRSSV